MKKEPFAKASPCQLPVSSARSMAHGLWLVFNIIISLTRASQVVLVVKNLPANAGDTKDTGSIPGSGRPPGEGKATYSSILAWKIPWAEEPGRLQSMGLQRVGHN